MHMRAVAEAPFFFVPSLAQSWAHNTPKQILKKGLVLLQTDRALFLPAWVLAWAQGTSNKILFEDGLCDGC